MKLFKLKTDKKRIIKKQPSESKLRKNLIEAQQKFDDAKQALIQAKKELSIYEQKNKK